MANGAGPAGVIGDDAEFSGRMTGADLTVFGRFDGELRLAGRLKIARQGKVEGVVHTAVAEIEGAFEGEIYAESLLLAETARVKGTFETKRLAIREGAVVEGAFNRGKAAPIEEAAPTPASTPMPVPTAAFEMKDDEDGDDEGETEEGEAAEEGGTKEKEDEAKGE
jgi:cytoskeletal protein CcmA (bactofilin family)